MTERIPTVSVIMPVHNAEGYLAEAVASILDQTFTDLEFIIVNDGSSDGSEAVIRSFADPRIKLISQTNQGISGALNSGLAVARGEFIARQDADDISLPQRLAKQVAFLRAHPKVGLLGTWTTIVSEDNAPVGAMEHPTEDAHLRFAVLFDTPFAHPTVMFRRDILESVGGYDIAPNIFEDFNMWSRMMAHTRGANLPEHLVRYRLLPTSFSHVTKDRFPRLLKQRLINLRNAFPDISEAMLHATAEYGLRHGPVPLKLFLPVQGLLNEHIDRTVSDPRMSRSLKRQVRHTMTGYRIIAHRSLLHRILDRTLKEGLLAWQDVRMLWR